MHRCFVPPSGWKGSRAELPKAEEHHLLDVLRVRDGETVGLFDGRGREAQGRVSLVRLAPGVAGPRSVIEIVRELPGTAPRVAVTLAQALLKGRKTDLVVEKAVELGASSVLPFVSERVIPRLNETQRRERAARWERIALAAAKQCGTSLVTAVGPVADFGEAVARCSTLDLFLVGSLREGRSPVSRVLHEAHRGGVGSVGLLIGPEGDLTESELALAVESGAAPVDLGDRVLRSETAALYGLSVLAYEFFNGGDSRPARPAGP
ncbi:RsmE family RNA methyltransferase [Verrucomicrobiota bacterium]